MGVYIIIGAAAFIVGVVVAAICIDALIKANKARAYKRRKAGEKEKPEKSKRKIEFSKLILALVLLPYFYGVHIGAKIVTLDVSQLAVFLGFIAAPTATAIGFYAWKAKAENMAKIRKAYPEETRDIDLNNIHT